MASSSSYPSVSVVIPTYNRPTQTVEAVKSVIGQTVSDFELIVVDDGSTCQNQELAELAKQFSFKYLKTENKGVAAARNTGVRQSSGKWVAFLDSDDRWLPNKLEAQLNFLSANPEYRIVQTREIWYRGGRFVNPRELHRMSSGDLFNKSLGLCVISPSAVLLEKSLFIEVGQFDEKMIVCEDYDLWLRITSANLVGLVDEELVEKFGGMQDQLSHSQVAMDRFRIYSLAKLLADHSLDFKLSDIQIDSAVAVLKQKLSILISGAMKRGNVDLEKVCSALQMAAGSENPVRNLSGLRNEFDLLIFDFRRQDEPPSIFA